VHPDAVLVRGSRSQPPWDPPKSLTETGAILPYAHHLQQPERQAGNEQQHNAQAVKKVHAAGGQIL
jgi:hypothetical protein